MPGNFKLIPTKETLTFAEVKADEMFFFENVFWTKHSFSLNGVTGARALVGYAGEHGTPNRVFANSEVVFKVLKIEQ